METNSKIALCVALSFFISFLILFILYQYQPLDDTKILEKKFYSQEFDPEQKRIVILGSSHVGRYNTTYINDKLSIRNDKYYVYNLAIIRDKPTERLKSLDNILLLKPKIVVYGISFRDFERQPLSVRANIEKPQSILPDPQKAFTDYLSVVSVSDYDFDFLKSPKIVTLNFIQNSGVHVYKIPEGAGPPDTPFYNHTTSNTLIIKTNQELKNEYQELYGRFRGIDPPDSNADVIALEKIITKLQENNVKIIIITNPHSRIYLDEVPESDKQLFNSILENISKKYNVDVYFLHDKYSDLNIWTDPDHITIRKEANIVNEDITKIILSEIDK